MKSKIIKSLAVISILASSSLLANETAPVPRAFMFSSGPAGSLPAGMITTRFFFSQQDVKNLNLGGVTSTRKDQMRQIRLRVGLGAGFDLRANLPFPNIKNKTTGETINNKFGNTAVILGKEILDQRKGDPLSLTLDLGIGVPTASASNAYGFKYGFRTSYVFAPHRVNFAFLGHEWASESNNAKTGSLYHMDAEYAFAINRQFDVFAEMTYDNQKNNKLATGTRAKNGFTTLIGSLGVAYKHRLGDFSIGAGYPIYQDYNASSTEKKAKGGVKYGATFVLRFNQPKPNK